MPGYMVWHDRRPSYDFKFKGTVISHNAWHAAQRFVQEHDAREGDRLFIVGPTSADDPVGGILYEVEATSLRVSAL